MSTGIQKTGEIHGIVETQKQDIIQHGETTSSILAAQAKAETEARLIVAMNRPRNWDVVRQKMLQACKRPGFAGSATEATYGAAYFSKPVGKSSIDGFSIRFAEEAIRNMGNMDARSTLIYDDHEKRIFRVEVFDLENNVAFPVSVVVEKTIERKFLKKGEVAISQRTNSYGDTVYLRAATDDEMMPKQNSAISKAIRNNVIRMLPGDIQSECRAAILKIRNGNQAVDPAEHKKQIIDSFDKIGVSVDNINELMDHDVASCSPSEMTMLRTLFTAIKDEKTTFFDELKKAKKQREAEDAPKDLKSITAELEEKNDK